MPRTHDNWSLVTPESLDNLRSQMEEANKKIWEELQDILYSIPDEKKK
jgi:hypothetical protein